MCSKQILSSACAYTHSKQNLCRSSNESWDVLLFGEKQWLWSACAFPLADLSLYLVDMSSCRKCCVPAHLISEAVLTRTQNICFGQKYEKYQSFFIWKFSVFGWEFFIYMYLNKRVFVMEINNDITNVTYETIDIQSYTVYVQVLFIYSRLPLSRISSDSNTSRYPYLDISELRDKVK